LHLGRVRPVCVFVDLVHDAFAWSVRPHSLVKLLRAPLGLTLGRLLKLSSSKTNFLFSCAVITPPGESWVPSDTRTDPVRQTAFRLLNPRDGEAPPEPRSAFSHPGRVNSPAADLSRIPPPESQGGRRPACTSFQRPWRSQSAGGGPEPPHQFPGR
jgi:hypothetical protein